MEKKIYKEFMEAECNDYVRHLLIEEIKKGLSSNEQSVSKHSFNRFNVNLDFQKNEAVIEDVIMYDNDIFSISIDNFLNDLEAVSNT
jgi:hypothetical protein